MLKLALVCEVFSQVYLNLRKFYGVLGTLMRVYVDDILKECLTKHLNQEDNPVNSYWGQLN